MHIQQQVGERDVPSLRTQWTTKPHTTTAGFNHMGCTTTGGGGVATTELCNHRGAQPRMYMARASFSPFLYFNQYKEWRKFISQNTTSHPH